MRFLSVSILGFLSALSPVVAENTPDKATVESAINRAIKTMQSDFSSEGGYATTWTISPFSASSEHRTSATVISIQPPGTTSLGRTFLRIYRATGNPVAREAAHDVARCLSQCQLSSGGWHSDYDPEPDYANRYHFHRQVLSGDESPGKRRHRSTLDDNKTQSALLFLLDWGTTDGIPRDQTVEDTLIFGLNSLLAAQRNNGGWPQQYDGTIPEENAPREATIPAKWSREWPAEPYSDLVTLNDGNLFHVLQVLLRAEEWKQDGRFQAAALRLGDFLLLAQLPKPQSGWAQQYNANMEPAWARKFEPPSVASVETYGAMETLFELWVATGEERFRNAIPPALTWLESSVLKDGSWARFYEMGSNRPLYMEAETYRLTYDDSNLPTHYGFTIDPKFANKLIRMRDSIDASRDEILESRNRVRSPSSWKKMQKALAPQARKILDQQAPSGIWSNDGRAEAKVWCKNLEALCDYLEAMDRSGDE